ncbi:HTH-type transcriptional regulator / antitoxin HigA [Pararobbsia alpina]
MDIRPLQTNADYEAALARVSALVDLDPAPASPDGNELDVLSLLVERYEAEHFPMGTP